MSEIQRYGIEMIRGVPEMEAWDGGDYVRYTDHTVEVAELSAALDAVIAERDAAYGQVDALKAQLARIQELWRMVANSKPTLNSAVSITWVEWMDAAMTPDADRGDV